MTAPKKILMTLMAFCLMISLPVFAEESFTLKDIEIAGNQRVETSTILSFMDLAEGESYTPEKIDNALKRVFATGLFADVAFATEGNRLLVKVVENPIVNQVVIEGNKRIEDDQLLPELKLSSRSIYTKTALQNDVKRILDIYQKSGRFSAEVTPKVIQLEQNRIDLVFEVDEGERTEIEQIKFVGNVNFSDRKLLEVIQTKESVWYRFFSSDDTYDPDRMAFDQELLRRFYVSKGYADFRVNSAVAELTPERDSFYITFTIEEGDRYNFGKMDVSSQVPDLEAGSMDNLLLSKEGDIFNADEIEKTVETLTRHLGNLGYAFVKIDTDFERDKVNDIIDINYVIKEGPRVYVDEINIKGNVRTLDQVVRREFRLAEGDPYNAAKLKRTEQRINNLGFFSKVDIKNIPDAESADKVDIDVTVEEQSTGELTIGAGFSTADGALGDIGVTERNLLGRGQILRANFTLSAARQEFDLGFTEPYFLGRNISAGVDLFNTKIDGSSSRTSRAFDSDTKGFALRTSYPLTEHFSHAVKYSLRQNDISDIDPLASRFIKDQEGETVTSLIGHSLTYDTRDSRFAPSEGLFVRLNQDFAGLGGDSEFIRHELRTGYYIPTFNDKWVLSFKGNGGYTFSYSGREIEINNRFFVGGDQIRGFENDGVGPRDSISKDSLGGNVYYAVSAEYSFPLGFAEDLGFSGAVFTDAGSLFQVDDSGPEVVDESSLRVSAGAGISWKSPLGPVRIDFAHAIAKESVDETEVVRFSFGTRF
jgi:outer membrane protein insertion porin family